ncbi:MAG: ABC transporter ATP-binding protein [Polyangiales bacterium]
MADDPSADASLLLRVTALNKSYQLGTQQVDVLRGVSLSVARGDYVAIMGASGSGKSTLLNVLGLLDDYDAGSYLLAGRETARLSEPEAARLRNEVIGFVFQSFHLLPQKKAWENVALPLSYRGLARAAQKRKAHEMLERLGLSHRADHRPSELSGGQRQRVAIARALVTDPQLVLADEPTGNLDTETSREVLHLLSEIHQEGRTVLLVTHELEVAAAARRIIHVRDGAIAGEHASGEGDEARA